MAEFYGNLMGRGEVAKTGTKATGITAVARSWEGSVKTFLWEQDGETMASITVGVGSTTSPNRLLYSGPLADLILRAVA